MSGQGPDITNKDIMITLKPIAFVKNSRTEISDDFWGGIISEITLTDDFDESAFKGIGEFSHLEIIFYFDSCLLV